MPNTTPTHKPPPSLEMPPFSTEHMSTQKVAHRFADLCSAGRNQQAIQDLYADNARHVEVMDAPWCPRIIEGKPALLKKSEEFARSTTIHSASCGKPAVNGDQFVVQMSLDCTSNHGPMAGQRMNISETALYTVKNGRITEGKFFYDCGT